MQFNIVFAGVIQNASKHLPKILKNIESLSRLTSESAYIFVENDSTDSTKSDLQIWGSKKKNFKLISLDGLNQLPARTVRLEILRNTYIEIIKQSEILSKFNYLIVMDMDEIGAYPFDLDISANALRYLDENSTRAGVFANQIGIYYDMWALRSKKLCPFDIWQEVLDYSHKHKVSDQTAFSETFEKRILSLDINSAPFEVDSAFGGFGIYKMGFITNNQNPYLGSKIKIITNDVGQPVILRTQICEHAHFNLGIKNQSGTLHIFPKLINAVIPKSTFNPSFFRSLLF